MTPSPFSSLSSRGLTAIAALDAIKDLSGSNFVSHKASRIITRAAAKHGLTRQLTITDVLQGVPSYLPRLSQTLLVKPVRTAAGVAVVAVMCKPHRCPHVEESGYACLYCPGGPDSDFDYSSQSYTGYEPTSVRAISARYDPLQQSRARLKELENLGHPTDKVEFIIMGGTFLALDQEYRDWFIRRLYDSLSNHTSGSVEEAIKFAERAQRRCVAITVETRPDFCRQLHIDEMLRYGATRLEIGVQTVFNDVAIGVGRGHTIEDVIASFYDAKRAGYKTIAHMMPDLPFSSIERDLFGFAELARNPELRIDGLKIYPTLVIRGTELYRMWKMGKHKSHSAETLILLLAHALSLVPPWVRVYRVQRDIPLQLVTAGADLGSQRSLASKKAAELHLPIVEIRNREPGSKEVDIAEAEIVRRDYLAQGAWETFLSYEIPSSQTLLGMLRLRLLEDAWRPELLVNERGPVSMIREVHVYGVASALNIHQGAHVQHRGFGSLLVQEAIRIAQYEHKSSRIAVIAGVGVREWYTRFGFVHAGPYMALSFE